MTFEGKSVMVTGGFSGIGKCCVDLLLAQGAAVVAFDRTAASAPTAAAEGHPRLLSVRGDVRSAKDVAKAVDLAVTTSGRLDIGINCAGVTGPLARLVDQEDDSIDEVLAINVRGIFLSMKHQLRPMLRQGFGAIVNAASVFSDRTMESYGLYVTSKHAVAGLTKSAAMEVAGAGIRINAVAPGPIKTPFLGPLTPPQESAASTTVPMRRLGEPLEAARAILWLASDEASFVTGSIMAVDGGMGANLISIPG